MRPNSSEVVYLAMPKTKSSRKSASNAPKKPAKSYGGSANAYEENKASRGAGDAKPVGNPDPKAHLYDPDWHGPDRMGDPVVRQSQKRSRSRLPEVYSAAEQ
jgi:hypothetical protein